MEYIYIPVMTTTNRWRSEKQKQENRYMPIRLELCKTFILRINKTIEALYIPNRPKQYKTTAIRINKTRQTFHTKGDQYKSNPDGQYKTETIIIYKV